MLAFTFKILLISYIHKYAKSEILRLKCEMYANFSVIHENRRQNSNTFRTLHATDESTCQLECSKEPKCKSINVNIDEEICELNDKSASDPMDRVVTMSSIGWRFYSPSYEERLVGINCRRFKPCPENEKCIDTCECPGYRCYGADSIYSSCNEALRFNYKIVGTFRIQHSKMASFVVAECKIENNTIIAVFHHGSEQTTEIDGFEEKASYRRVIAYNNSTLDDLKDFVDSSVSCRQFTRFDCHAMHLIDGYLMDRNKAIMEYFGGGPQDGKGCRCGIDKSCAIAGQLCNCYTNDVVWRHDEGYITDKKRLPLAEVRLGDTGSANEYGKHTIGPLLCIEAEI